MIKQHFQAAIVTLMALACISGCAMFGNDAEPMDDLRDTVRAAVQDPERASLMLAKVDEIDALADSVADVLTRARGEREATFRDYASSREDFRRVFTASMRERMMLQQELLAAHFDLKAAATEAEWQVIGPAETAALSAIADAMQAEIVSQD